MYKLPSIVVPTLPIAVLFGTLLSLGRLAKDSEITVLLGTGTPFRRLAVPILFSRFGQPRRPLCSMNGSCPKATIRRRLSFARHFFAIRLPSIEQGVFFRGADERYFYVGEVDRRNRTMSISMIYLRARALSRDDHRSPGPIRRSGVAP